MLICTIPKKIYHKSWYAVQSAKLVPGSRRQPLGGIGEGILEADAAGQQEHPLSNRELALFVQQVHGQQEREEQLVLLEEWTTYVDIQRIGEAPGEVLQTLFYFLHWRRVVNRILKEIDEPGEGVLIHRVDIRQHGCEKDSRTILHRYCLPKREILIIIIMWFFYTPLNAF